MVKKLPREKRMNEIVTVAVAEFLEKGYENASMEAIAVRAGLTKGGLYHHFNSKDEILGYANLYLSKPIEKLVICASKEASALNGLRTYIQRYVRFWLTRPRELAFFFLTMTKAFEVPEMRELFTKYHQTMHTFLAALFARAVEEGTLAQHDSAIRATTLMAALDGITANLVLDSSLKADCVIRELQDLFVNSLIVSSPQA